MMYRMTLLTAILAVFFASYVARQRIDNARRPAAGDCPDFRVNENGTVPFALPAAAAVGPCRRIVSMAPSITETLYALGAGDRLVGVTRDCVFPPEVEKVKRQGNVGGYYDPNFEAIFALRPDLVVLLEEQSSWLPSFENLNIKTLVVRHKTTDGIIESFGAIGLACGKGAEGRRMRRDFQNRVERIRAKTRPLSRPRVLFVVDRTYGCGQLADIYVAADDGYIDAMIRWAGGQNVYRQRGVRYPVVSAEGILWLNPEVIVDLVPPDTLRRLGRRAILDDWKTLKGVRAVENDRVLIPDRDYAYVPGPRFLELAEYLARAIHPEMKWER